MKAKDAPPVSVRAAAGSRVWRELSALGLAILVLFAVLSLISFHSGEMNNVCGPVGADLAHQLDRMLGFHAYFLLVLVTGIAVAIWMNVETIELLRILLGGIFIVTASGAAWALATGNDPRLGGAVSDALAGAIEAYVSFGGGYLVVIFAALCGLTLLLRSAPTELIAAISNVVWLVKRKSDSGEAPGASSPLELSDPANATLTGEKSGLVAPRTIELRRDSALSSDRKPALKPRIRGCYKLPPHSLLDMPSAEHRQVDEAILERSARLVEEKLTGFGVDGRVVGIQPGPVVTMYKFEPASGVKVAQIVNLADDLSLALKAASVRIQAPVPGEAVVGIEVPNRKREKVYLREILDADEFQAAQSLLTIALGKDISGVPVAADLARMPHLLIAGATGTGKSVSIHTMIASILFNATADDVRFILIDPKMLELSVYENIPHLLVPVVVDPEKAASALLWATQEMENRYRRMRELGVRNLDGYNQALAQGARIVELGSQQMVEARIAAVGTDAVTPPLQHRKLPRIVIVIDELADLLLSEGKSVERDITRLAQKARAAGIHLILATQRPSVDVITGLIKANLPARISLQVTSRVDSRTILDSIGAERLLGAGDMLFLPPGTAKLRRLHGPFVSEAEIRKVTDFLRAQGAPDYQMDILETRPRDEMGGAGENGQRDEMYEEAVRIVLESNQASISMIQRRLRIGYNRAARMVEQMEREGLVAPADGARPREVRTVR